MSVISELPFICKTSGEYFLEKDLVYEGEDFAIIIACNDVIIDGNNFSIQLKGKKSSIYNIDYRASIKNLGFSRSRDEEPKNFKEKKFCDDVYYIDSVPFVCERPGTYYLTKDLIYYGPQSAITVIADNVNIEGRSHKLQVYNKGSSFINNIDGDHLSIDIIMVLPPQLNNDLHEPQSNYYCTIL